MNASAPKLWRSLAIASIIPVVLAALTIWFGNEYKRADQTSADIRLTYRQQLAIEALVSRMKDAETGQRGYVITGDPAFLEPYKTAKASVPGDLKALSHILAQGGRDDAVQVQRINQLVSGKFVEMERVLRARDTQGLNAAAALVSEGRGKKLMDDIRAAVARLVAEKGQALQRNLTHEDRRTDLIRTASWIIVGLVAVVALAGAYLIWHSRNERFHALRRARESTARQTAIFDNSLDAIILINPSGGIEILNRAAVRLFGYPATHLERRDISLIVDLAPGEGTFLERLGVQDGAIAEPFRTPLIARRRDGEKVAIEVALAPMEQDDGVHIVAAFRDISERAKIEKMKDEFLSTVSHELRTPLTSILGSLSLIRGGVTGEIPPEAQRLVIIAENNANRLVRLVNDLLDMEKLQSGGMAFAFEPIDLRATGTSAIESVRGLADQQHITLEIDAPTDAVTVRGDAGRLSQVITNLLSNAVRFSPVGSHVVVQTNVHAGMARVSVIDHGPGIEPDLRSRLFTRFAQSSQITAATPGTGLGLAISREIVRSHGGNIWWEETAGGGSTFVFTLPLWNVFRGREELGGKPCLLLYVDEADATVIAEKFDRKLIETQVVASSAEAMAALQDRAFLAMIIDFQFANGGAMALIETIRADSLHRGLPIIAVVNEEPVDGEMGSLDIIDWIQKPISPERLGQAVGASFERVSAEVPLILHVDDDADTLEITSIALSGHARMAQATDVASARAYLAENAVDILIIDLGLPDGSGLEILEYGQGAPNRTTPVIIYSAQDKSAVPSANNVRAVLTKSKRSLPNLVETVMGLIEKRG